MLKFAYDAGVRQALVDAGLVKLSGSMGSDILPHLLDPAQLEAAAEAGSGLSLGGALIEGRVPPMTAMKHLLLKYRKLPTAGKVGLGAGALGLAGLGGYGAYRALKPEDTLMDKIRAAL